MAQRAGRITCPRCGANNFDTVTSCWKCGAPVGSAAAAPAAPMPAPSLGPPAAQAPYGQPPMQPSYIPERAQPPIMQTAPAPTGDPAVARRAAIWLGITLPFLGLPVGWIFMMIEDRNKQAVGRVCATWSLLGLVLHFALTWFMFQQTLPMLRMLTNVAAAMGQKSAGSENNPLRDPMP